MGDRNQLISDIIITINNLSNFDMSQDFPLDPPEIPLLIENNKKHLELEINKGNLTSEQLSNIQTAINTADTFISNHSNNSGGGGSSIAYFIDCSQGFTFAVDFSPKSPPIQIGSVYSMKANGYKGCATLVRTPDRRPAAYTSGELASSFRDCETCKSTL